MRTTGLTVSVDLGRVVGNAARIRERVGAGRLVYAVVKADGYGLGAFAVARAVAGVCDGYYAFDLSEAVGAELKAIGKPVIVVDQPWRGYTADDYRAAGVRPIVGSRERLGELAALDPVLSVDTGMRRFGVEADEIAGVLKAFDVREVMTHASRFEQVGLLVELAGGGDRKLHAAASALIDEPRAWLDGVRPGLALYRGAMRVSTRVIEARDVHGVAGAVGRAGYGQFEAERVGVILGGYSDGMKAGVCLVRGERRRVYEVGMQSGYVELKAGEGVGEEVVLLGDGLTEAEVAAAWGVSEQEVLVRMGRHRAGK